MPAIKITPKREAEIIDEINKWEGKLTWSSLCEFITVLYSFDTKISRHTLLSYPPIKDAFNNKKVLLKKELQSNFLEYPELASALKEIKRLNTEVERLNKQNLALKERHATWLQNIYTMKGIDLSMLDEEPEKVKALAINGQLQKNLVKLNRKDEI